VKLIELPASLVIDVLQQHYMTFQLNATLKEYQSDSIKAHTRRSINVHPGRSTEQKAINSTDQAKRQETRTIPVTGDRSIMVPFLAVEAFQSEPAVAQSGFDAYAAFNWKVSIGL